MKQNQLVAAKRSGSTVLIIFSGDPRNPKSRPPCRGDAEIPARAERLGKVGARAGLDVPDPVQQPRQLALPSGRRHEVAHIVIENDQARRVALEMRHIGERRGQELRVFKFLVRCEVNFIDRLASSRMVTWQLVSPR